MRPSVAAAICRHKHCVYASTPGQQYSMGILRSGGVYAAMGIAYTKRRGVKRGVLRIRRAPWRPGGRFYGGSASLLPWNEASFVYAANMAADCRRYGRAGLRAPYGIVHRIRNAHGGRLPPLRTGGIARFLRNATSYPQRPAPRRPAAVFRFWRLTARLGW